MTKVCQQCKGEYEAPPSSNKKFCSCACYGKSMIGKPPCPWRMGKFDKILTKTCELCSKVYTTYGKSRRYCSTTCMHQSPTYQTKRSQSLSKYYAVNGLSPNSACGKKGREISAKHRQRIGEANKGEKSHLWKGGISSYTCSSCGKQKEGYAKCCLSCHKKKFSYVTPKNARIRNSSRMKVWRTAVFERDNYSCLDCGLRGGRLQADHIIPFAVLIRENTIRTYKEALACEELWDVENGRTLCVPCHKEHTKIFLREYFRGFYKGKPLLENRCVIAST